MYKKIFSFILIMIAVLTLSSVAVHAEGISTSNWAINYADFCIATRMIPATRSTFNPSAYFKRYEVAVALANAENVDLADSISTGFSDVPAGVSYAGEVRWTYNNGLITGYTDGTFGPNNRVTRQELCVILNRFIKKFGINTLPATGTTPSFTDYSSIPGWALTQVQELYWAGIVTGFPDGSFRPGNYIPREEVACLLTRTHAYTNNHTDAVNIFLKDILGSPVSDAFVYVYRPNDYTPTMRPYGPSITNSNGISRTACTLSPNASHGINIVYKNMYDVEASLGVPEQKQPGWKYVFIETRAPKEVSNFVRPIRGYSGITHWPHSGCTTTCRNTFSTLCPHNYFYSDRNFGWRYGTGNDLEFHPAYDLAYSVGTPVYAGFISGTVVVHEGWEPSAGNYIQLKCENTGAYLSYCHLNSISVGKNQYILPNSESIGTVGNTGNNSEGAHLHFSISRTIALAPNNDTPSQIKAFFDLVEEIH